MTATSHPPSVPLASGWRALPPEYAIPAHAPSEAEAREYCRRLARSHYENFSVASWFLPKDLRQHFFNVYAYCRISDDLGDEVGDSAASLQLLDQWGTELNACYEGHPRHPVFVALAETVRQFEIPKHEFADLLTAFRQDQTVSRYETFADLLGYCRYSANPVGHLVLYLCGYCDSERQLLSDYTCTALQLANFWQDVSAEMCIRDRSDADLLLVVGSDNSSNSKRLVEVARSLGTEAHLIDDCRDIQPQWLNGVKTVALTAGASAPEHLVQEVVEYLAGQGFGDVQELEIMPENVRFGLPPEIVATIAAAPAAALGS